MCLDPVVHHDLLGAADHGPVGVGVVDDVVPVRPQLDLFGAGTVHVDDTVEVGGDDVRVAGLGDQPGDPRRDRGPRGGVHQPQVLVGGQPPQPAVAGGTREGSPVRLGHIRVVHRMESPQRHLLQVFGVQRGGERHRDLLAGRQADVNDVAHLAGVQPWRVVHHQPKRLQLGPLAGELHHDGLQHPRIGEAVIGAGFVEHQRDTVGERIGQIRQHQVVDVVDDVLALGRLHLRILNLLERLQAGGVRRGQQRDARLRNGSGRRVQILNPGVEQVAPLLERGRVGADAVADAHQGVEPAVLLGLELAALGRHDVALAQPGCAGQAGPDHHALQRLTGCVADPGHQGRGRDRIPAQKRARRTHRVRDHPNR